MAVLNEKQAAQELGLSVHTLRKWRRLLRGPAFMKIPGAMRRGHGRAGRVLYRDEDLRAFQAEMTVPTSNPVPTLVSRRVYGV